MFVDEIQFTNFDGQIGKYVHDGFKSLQNMGVRVVLAGHDMRQQLAAQRSGAREAARFEHAVDDRLSDEVGEFIAGLPITAPTSFVARWFTLFRFEADWDGKWWEDMPWEHVKSWAVD